MRNLLYVFLVILLFNACGNGDGGGASEGVNSGGQGGSMARFAVVGDYLYTVDYNELKMFDISDAAKPAYLPSKNQTLGGDAETIFPLDTLLFIGSQTGMLIYDISRPDFPNLLAHETHIKSCDPVVSDGRFAYVTLNSENTFCGRSSNELLVYDLKNITKPELIHTVSNLYAPRGLGILADKLYVCDNGLKVFDISDPAVKAPVWIGDLSHIPSLRTLDAYDVIPLADSKIILLIGADGLYELDTNGEKLSLVGSIEVKRTNR
ncbi:MAG: hypothetical protein LBR18_09300 [Tannerella sp.]|nr:hypothetical protein [Tannerella sp.]